MAQVERKQTKRNPYPPFEIASSDQIEALHEASLEVLRDIGMKVTEGRARDLLARLGAEVDADKERPREQKGDDG